MIRRNSTTKQRYESLKPGVRPEHVAILGIVDANGKAESGTRPATRVRNTRVPTRVRRSSASSPGESACATSSESPYRRGLGRRLNPKRWQRCPTVEEMQPLLEAWNGTMLVTSRLRISGAGQALWRGTTRGIHLGIVQKSGVIADQLCLVERHVCTRGASVIGATRMGDVAEERQPGMTTKRHQYRRARDYPAKTRGRNVWLRSRSFTGRRWVPDLTGRGSCRTRVKSGLGLGCP